MLDFKNLQVQHENAEINSHAKGINVANEGVEIFSAIVNGKDTSRYGAKVDQVMAYMKNLGDKAVSGDTKAKAEINAIRTIMIQAPLMKRLNLFDFMGNVIRVAKNEEVRYRVYSLDGKKSGFQANSGSFPFPTAKFRTDTMSTQAITGGLLMDYNEIAVGGVDGIAMANEQVITDMMNQMFYTVMNSLYSKIKAFGGVKNFVEASGLTKSAVDTMARKIKRYGTPSILSDITMIDLMSDFAGFTTDIANGVKTFSESVMEEIRRTGRLQMYKGMPIVEMPNTYNTTKLNSTGDYFDLMLPEGLLFFLIAGELSPLQIGIKGSLESMSATDINLRAEVTRFDLQFGTHIIDEYIHTMAIISNSDYEVDKL